MVSHMLSLFLTASFLCLSALAVTSSFVPTAPGGPPKSFSDFVFRERNDPCFQNISSSLTHLTDYICPGTLCSAKFDNLTQVLINSGHNSYALDGHFLLFQRDMACMRPAGTDDMCVKQFVNVTNQWQLSRLFTFRNWAVGVYSLSEYSEELDKQFISTSDDPSAIAINKSKYAVCDPSHCLNKHLLQWAAWLSRVPRQYLAELPPAFSRPGYSADDVVGEAGRFFGKFADKCNRNGTTGRINGTIADIKLEVDQSVPQKVEHYSAGFAYSRGLAWLVVVPLVLMASLL